MRARLVFWRLGASAMSANAVDKKSNFLVFSKQKRAFGNRRLRALTETDGRNKAQRVSSQFSAWRLGFSHGSHTPNCGVGSSSASLQPADSLLHPKIRLPAHEHGIVEALGHSCVCKQAQLVPWIAQIV